MRIVRAGRSATTATLLIVAFLSAPLVSAQEAATEPNWSVIRRSTFAAIDRGTAQRWLESEIRSLWNEQDTRNAQTRASAFYKKMVEHYRATDATREFREGIAEILAATFGKLYQPTPDNSRPPKPLGISAVLMVLRDFAQPSSLDDFRAALQDPAAGPRFVASEGLAAIANRLNEQQWAALVPELQRAASKEPNTVVLARMYRILISAGTGPRAEAVTATLMAILDARLDGMEQGTLRPCEADGEVIEWLGRRAAEGGAANALRQELLPRTAKLFAYGCDAYLRRVFKPTYTMSLEELIIQTETRLEDLVKQAQPDVKLPSPAVRIAMLEDGDARYEQMKQSLMGWIGSAQTRGVLNAAPFNLPVGLGITLKAVAPATAPAGS